LSVSGTGHFAPVQINENLTFDFADDPELSGGAKGRSHHYAFHVSEDEFEAIFNRVKAKGIPYGSGPFSHTDGKIKNVVAAAAYFEDPNGHLLEVMTVPETGS
jgi:catechol 2,3-dioxygenase-like lactoylglutathione lyase family enzyme